MYTDHSDNYVSKQKVWFCTKAMNMNFAGCQFWRFLVYFTYYEIVNVCNQK